MGDADEDGWRRLITVEDRFELRSVGLALAPCPELRAAGRVNLDLVLRPFRCAPVRRWTALLRGLSAADAPLGTEVWVPSSRFSSDG